MKQEDRNKIAVEISEFLNKKRPKPDILDCLNILNNLQEQFINELDYNFEEEKK